MGNLKLGVRLAIAFGLVLALLLVAVGLAVAGVRGAQQQAAQLEQENGLLQAANGMRAAQLRAAVAIRDFVGQTNVERQRAAFDALGESEKAYAEAADALEALVGPDGHHARLRPLVLKLEEANAPIAARLREAMELSGQAEYAQAQAIVYDEVRENCPRPPAASGWKPRASRRWRCWRRRSRCRCSPSSPSSARSPGRDRAAPRAAPARCA